MATTLIPTTVSGEGARRQRARRRTTPIRCSLTRFDLFADLPEHDLEILENRLAQVHWPRGADMPEPLGRPDTLFLVRSGQLALFERAAGEQHIMVSLLEEGAIYSTLGVAPATQIAALANCAITPLSARAIEGLVARYPRLGVNLARVLSRQMKTQRETVALVSEMRVEDRLRARIHQLAEQFGTAGPDGISLGLELTHAQWASLVGASREAVTTAFSRLRAADAVVMNGRTVTLPWESMKSFRAGVDDPPRSAAHI